MTASIMGGTPAAGPGFAPVQEEGVKRPAGREVDMNRGPAPDDGANVVLKEALVQSQDVEHKVVAVAEALGTTNDEVRGLISAGAEFLHAGDSLAQNEEVESNVKEVADDLGRINGALRQGVEDLEVIGEALDQSHAAQRETEARLDESLQEGALARHRALHDSLTDLPNRTLFDDRLVQAIALAERHSWTLAVMFIDLDRFKTVNDTFGHAAGDLVLKETARRLELHARTEDTVCRYGGDEFLYLLVNPNGSDNVDRIRAALTAGVAVPVDIGRVKVSIGASVGVAYYPDNGTSGPQLVAFADEAMYADKRTRSDTTSRCSPLRTEADEPLRPDARPSA